MVLRFSAAEGEYQRSKNYVAEYYPDVKVYPGPFSFERDFSVLKKLRAFTGSMMKIACIKADNMTHQLITYHDIVFFNGENLLRGAKAADDTRLVALFYPIGDNVDLIECYDPTLLREIYKQMDVLVTMRLHAGILSLSALIPVVGIFSEEWGLKNPGIMKDYHMPYTLIEKADCSQMTLPTDIQKTKIAENIQNNMQIHDYLIIRRCSRHEYSWLICIYQTKDSVNILREENYGCNAAFMEVAV